MSRKSLLASLAIGLALFTACSQPAAPGAPVASSAATPPAPASASPASPAAEPAGNAVDDFLAKLSQGQSSVTTYSINMKTKTAVNGTDVAITMKGSMDQTDAEDVDFSATMSFAGMKMKMIKVDGAMYMQMAATGKKWVKVPQSQMAEYESGTNVDYAAQLTRAKDSITSVELVGQETVAGASASHYRIVFDADAFAKMSGGSTQDATVATDNFDYDVWLDDTNRPRRVAMSLTVKAEGKELPMSIQATMSDYDKPVTITAPPKSQVVQG